MKEKLRGIKNVRVKGIGVELIMSREGGAT
jgi:hypothetical protein